VNDARLFSRARHADNIDRARKIVGGRLGGGGENHERAAKLHAVAAAQRAAFDAFAVHERAVGAAEIDEKVELRLVAQFGVAARNLRIVQLHVVHGVATERNHVLGQFKATALIAALDNE